MGRCKRQELLKHLISFNRRLCFYSHMMQTATIVSRHSVTSSQQIGGDPSYAAGYNLGSLASRLWSNPKKLAESVLRDVQTDSIKYVRK